MAANEFASIVVPTNILDHEQVIDFYTYFNTMTSPPSQQTQPPLWISSFSERKHALKGKNASSNSSTNSGINQSGNDGIVQEPIQHKNTTKEKLLQYLKSLSGKSIISGLYLKSRDADPNESVEVMHRIIGVHPGIITLKMPNYRDGVTHWQSFTEKIISSWNNGYLVHIVWWPHQHPFRHFNIVDNYKMWADLVNDNGYLNQVWKKHLDAIVPYFQQLQNVAVFVFCDFFPWINFSIGYSWGGRLGMSGSLRLYQITHDYMTQNHNLHSLLWTLSLFEGGRDTTNLKAFWPGNEYVDVVSAYVWNPEEVEMTFYQNLLKVVGDTLISMECLWKPPSPALLGLQPRWTWFTVEMNFNEAIKNNATVKAMFENDSVINNENNEFFKTLNSN